MDTAPNANNKKTRPPSDSSSKAPKRSKTLKTGKNEQPYDLPNQPALRRTKALLLTHQPPKKQIADAKPPIVSYRETKTVDDEPSVLGDNSNTRRNRLPFKLLTPGSNPACVFIACILARNFTREYTNLHGGGKILEVFTSDTEGAVMRVPIFNAGVERFHDVVEPGATCSFSGGRLKPASQEFVLPGSKLEASFDDKTVITRVAAADAILTEPILNLSLLSALESASHDTTVSFIGVIHVVNGIKEITTRKRKLVDKREFLVVDEGGTSLVCTSWGRLAREITDEISEMVVLVSNGRVSDYRNSNLSM